MSRTKVLILVAFGVVVPVIFGWLSSYTDDSGIDLSFGWKQQERVCYESQEDIPDSMLSFGFELQPDEDGCYYAPSICDLEHRNQPGFPFQYSRVNEYDNCYDDNNSFVKYLDYLLFASIVPLGYVSFTKFRKS